MRPVAAAQAGLDVGDQRGPALAATSAQASGGVDVADDDDDVRRAARPTSGSKAAITAAGLLGVAARARPRGDGRAGGCRGRRRTRRSSPRRSAGRCGPGPSRRRAASRASMTGLTFMKLGRAPATQTMRVIAQSTSTVGPRQPAPACRGRTGPRCGHEVVVEVVVVGEQHDRVGGRQLLRRQLDPHRCRAVHRAPARPRAGRPPGPRRPCRPAAAATRTAGDSRASPVFFLYARPSSRTRRAVDRALRGSLSASMIRRTT